MYSTCILFQLEVATGVGRKWGQDTIRSTNHIFLPGEVITMLMRSFHTQWTRTKKRSPQQEENLVKMKDPLMGTVSINPEGSDSYSPNRTVFNMEASVPWKEYFLNHPAKLREILGQNPVEQVIKTNRSINLHKGQWRFYLGWCGEAWCQWWLYHLWQGHNWPAIQVIYQDSFLIVNQQGKLKDWN